MRVIAGLLLFFAFAASAQTVPGSVGLEWTLPTVGCTVGVSPCDNRPLTGAAALTAIEVYISTSSIPDNSIMAPTLTLGPAVTTATHTMQVANGATLFVRLKARNAGGVSPFNVQASKVVTAPVVPGVPSSVTITITITPAQ